MPSKYVIVQYMPISKVMSDTEYKTAIQSMERTILKLEPSQVISLDDDYLKYMSVSTQEKFATRYKTLDRLKTSVSSTCESVSTLMDRSYMNDSPVYIFRDENTLHAETARVLAECLRQKGHEVNGYRVQTLSDLKRSLLEIRPLRKGFLISITTAITDEEVNKILDQDAINYYILRLNSKHIDVAFAKGNINLSVILVPRIVGAKMENNTITVEQVVPRLYLNPERLKTLDASILYKNMFDEIIGVMKE